MSKMFSQHFKRRHVPYGPGDPKLLVTSQSPRKAGIQIVLLRGCRRENRGKERWSSVSRNVTFLKKTTSLSFSPFPLFRTSNLGKIDANFSGEIVTSSAVLNHRGTDNISIIKWAEICDRRFKFKGVLVKLKTRTCRRKLEFKQIF